MPKNPLPTLRSGLAALMAGLMIITVPSAARAQAPSTGNTAKPSGYDAKAYTYNSATGLWENEHYTWNPVTNQTKPKVTPSYSYNSATGMWDTTEWIYNPATGSYEANTVSVAKNPNGGSASSPASQSAITDSPSAGSSTATPATDASSKTAAAQQDAQASGQPEGTAPSATSSPGPNTKAAVEQNGSGTGYFDLYTNSAISNTVVSTALTGDAAVTYNTTAGDAATGDATGMANIINMLQSSWNPDGTVPATFLANIDGSVVGDLTIDPAQFNPSVSVGSEQLPGDVDINVQNNGSIYNNVNLSAETGDAKVKYNTEAGDATSGNATAVANVMNLINSSIGAGQSFIGTLNINGDFDGDVLVAKNVLDKLLASNAPQSQLVADTIENKDVLAEFSNTSTITNNVTAEASTGNATVANNTQAGNATSGDATTNVTILNLTGRQIIGKNALLVFVNVLGKWVGMIMDAPGSTAAALGGGIQQNGAVPGGSSLAVRQSDTSTITNDINVRAASGNASVAHNTVAGDATTGNAHAAANVLNMTGSQLSMADWFGILFINVFGSWNGSFGVNTAAGGNGPTPAVAGGRGTSPGPNPVKVFQFTPGTETAGAGSGGTAAANRYRLKATTLEAAAASSNQIADSSQQTQTDSQVIGSTGEPQPPVPPASSISQPDRFQYTLPAVGLGFAGMLLGAERLVGRRDKKRLPGAHGVRSFLWRKPKGYKARLVRPQTI